MASKLIALIQKSSRKANLLLTEYNSTNTVQYTLEDLVKGFATEEVQAQRQQVDSYCKVERFKEELMLIDLEIGRVKQHITLDINTLRKQFVEDTPQAKLRRIFMEREVDRLEKILGYEVIVDSDDGDSLKFSDDESTESDDDLFMEDNRLFMDEMDRLFKDDDME